MFHIFKLLLMTSPACCEGYLETGKSSGEFGNYANQPAYISKPKEVGKKAIMIGTDIFGYRLNNIQLIADEFAKHGFLVIIPDLFNEGAFKAENIDPLLDIGLKKPTSFAEQLINYGKKSWALLAFLPFFPFFMYKHPPSSKHLIFIKISEQLREEGYEFVGYQGYCYGGTIGFDISGTKIANAISIAHPGTFDINLFRRDFKTPFLGLLIKNDMNLKDVQIAELQKFANGRSDISFEIFDNHHGFAVRANTTIEEQRLAKEKAFEKALAFFQSHFHGK
eukprot:NODE_30_length_37342_cov_0.449507.p16 type:complete len:279 gc:universal NODE_30_length_37342_cov_0.449507:13889-13053(-)